MTDTQSPTGQACDAETDHVLAERLKIIRLKQAGIDEATKIVYDRKESLKEAKDMREGRILDLGDFIRDGSLPLFDRPEDGNTGIPETEQDGWRIIHLSELTDPIIKPAVLAKLANAGIETIGEMADKTALATASPDGSDQFDLVHIPGIGAKAADHIEDALAAFWERRKNQQAIEAYQASIREIPASAIKLPKDKSLFDYYCAPELAEATDDKPAEVRAFEHDKCFYTITASDGTEDGPKTAEAWRLTITGTHYAGPIRNRGPHPTDLWRGYEGQVVVVNGKERIMTDQVQIMLDKQTPSTAGG